MCFNIIIFSSCGISIFAGWRVGATKFSDGIFCFSRLDGLLFCFQRDFGVSSLGAILPVAHCMREWMGSLMISCSLWQCDGFPNFDCWEGEGSIDYEYCGWNGAVIRRRWRRLRHGALGLRGPADLVQGPRKVKKKKRARWVRRNPSTLVSFKIYPLISTDRRHTPSEGAKTTFS